MSNNNMQETVNGFTRGQWKWTSGEAHNLTCQKMNGEELDIILGTETAQQRANTRLVVAAPLLYKQLKDIVANFEHTPLAWMLTPKLQYLLSYIDIGEDESIETKQITFEWPALPLIS